MSEQGTEVYGASDDLIEIDGAAGGEHGSDDALLVGSDGTVLHVKYGKGALGIWHVIVLRKGELFDRVEPCHNEDAERYSDTAYFRPGMKWFYAANEFAKVE